jgi:hypothetical protein
MGARTGSVMTLTPATWVVLVVVVLLLVLVAVSTLG